MFARKILILVAHPDDEVVACAASIARAQAEGADCATLYLTHGCVAQDVMWRWRRKTYPQMVETRRVESLRAAKLLNVHPVGIADRPARYLWRQLPQVMAEVEAAIARWRPDQIWVPAYEGGNPDHDALNAIGFKLKNRHSVLEFAEYNFFGGRARSQTFIAPDETTRVLILTTGEQKTKRQALALYESERGNLSYIGVDQESYRPIAVYDYTRPPHQGVLWYARFQWVPFAHPQVDFTNPLAVSAAIVDFL